MTRATVFVVLFIAELRELQQDKRGSIASSKANNNRMKRRSATASKWRIQRPFKRHTTTTFSAVAHENQEEVRTSEHGSSVASNRHPMEGDMTAYGDEGYVELPMTGLLGRGRKWETEWTKVAEILDRFFFFLFMALLLIPTVAILGIVRLFKPEL